MADEGESEGGAPMGVPAPQVGGRRKHGVTARRALLVVIGACLAIAIGLAGWLYWTHPSTTTASLPDGVQRGEEEYLSGALPPPVTRHGMLSPGPLHSRNHEWVGTVTWKPFNAAEQDYELHLGESVHIEGLWPALNKVSFWGCVVGWFWGYRYRMCVWLLM